MRRVTALLLAVWFAPEGWAQVRVNTWSVAGMSTSSTTWTEVPGSVFDFDAGSPSTGDGSMFLFESTLACSGTGDPCAQLELQTVGTPASQWGHVEASAANPPGAARAFTFDYSNSGLTRLHVVARAAGQGGMVDVGDLHFITLDFPRDSGVEFQETAAGNPVTLTAAGYQPLMVGHARRTDDHLVLATVTASNAQSGLGLRVVGLNGNESLPTPLPNEGNRGYFLRSDGQFASWTFLWYGPLTNGDTVTVQGIANPRVDAGASQSSVLVPETRLLLVPSTLFATAGPGISNLHNQNYVTFSTSASATVGGSTLGVFAPNDRYLMLRSAHVGVVGEGVRVESVVNGVLTEVVRQTRATSQTQLAIAFADIVRSASPLMVPALRFSGFGPDIKSFVWETQVILLGPLASSLGGGGATLNVTTAIDGGLLDGGSGAGGGAGGSGGGGTSSGGDAGAAGDGGRSDPDGGPDGPGTLKAHRYLVGCGCTADSGQLPTWTALALALWGGRRRKPRA